MASERVIHDVMERAARKARVCGLAQPQVATPADAAMAGDSEADLARDGFFSEEALEDDSLTYFRASEGALGMLRFIFAHGPHPKAVLVRAVWLADKIAPELLLKMSGRDWAKVLNESPWAWHARDRAMREQVRRAVGYRGEMVFPTQKSKRARKRMAAAAKGNKHRASSVAA